MTAGVSVACAASARLPTTFGTFQAWGYRSLPDGREHLALTMGGDGPARVHVACTSGDVLGSHGCGCRGRLDEALQAIAGAGAGVLVYVRGRGERLGGCPEPDPRDRAVAELILRDLGERRPL